MVNLGSFKSCRLEEIHGMCCIKGINRIKDAEMCDTFFEIYISDGIIYVDKYIYGHLEGTIHCSNRFIFDELTINEN